MEARKTPAQPSGRIELMQGDFGDEDPTAEGQVLLIVVEVD